MHKNKNFFKNFFLIIFVFNFVLSFFVFPLALAQGETEPQPAQAEQEQDLRPQIQIEIGGYSGDDFKPTTKYTCEGGGECIDIDWLAQYISVIYRYGIGIAAILAVVMIMAGGFLWLISAGSPDKIGKAKEFITAALTGLMLALFSFIILNAVNPNLVTLKPLTTTISDPGELSTKPGFVESDRLPDLREGTTLVAGNLIFGDTGYSKNYNEFVRTYEAKFPKGEKLSYRNFGLRGDSTSGVQMLAFDMDASNSNLLRFLDEEGEPPPRDSPWAAALGLESEDSNQYRRIYNGMLFTRRGDNIEVVMAIFKPW